MINGFDLALTRFDLLPKIFKQFLKIVRKFRGVTRLPQNPGKIFTRGWHKIFVQEVFGQSQIRVLIFISIILLPELQKRFKDLKINKKF